MKTIGHPFMIGLVTAAAMWLLAACTGTCADCQVDGDIEYDVDGETEAEIAIDGDVDSFESVEMELDDFEWTDENRPEMIIYPYELYFGAMVVGESVRRNLEICNAGNGILKLRDVEIQQEGYPTDAGDYTVVSDDAPSADSVVSLASGACYSLIVQYEPIDEDISDGQLIIVSNVGVQTVRLIQENKCRCK